MKILKISLLIWALFYGSGKTQPLYEAETTYIQLEILSTPIISGGYFLQDNLALNAGAAFRSNEDADATGFILQLGLDNYLSNESLTPYMGGLVRFEINPVAFGRTSWKGSRIVLAGHWGLNYFILQRLSVSGRIGLDLNINSPQNRDDSVSLGTFTSGLEVKFYF